MLEDSKLERSQLLEAAVVLREGIEIDFLFYLQLFSTNIHRFWINLFNLIALEISTETQKQQQRAIQVEELTLEQPS